MTNQTFQLSRRKFLTQSLTALGGVSLMGSLSGCGPSPDNSTESKVPLQQHLSMEVLYAWG